MQKSNQMKRQPLSLLLMGPPGSGKSTLCLQFPSPYVLDCDLNLDGPVRTLKRLNIFQEFVYDTVTLDDNGSPVAPEKQYERFLACLQAAIKDPTIKTIVVDGLTQLNTILYNHVADKTKHKVLEIQDWGEFRRQLTGVISILRSCGKDIIMTCHEETKTDKQGNVEKYTPACQTKITDYLGGFFTDLWACEAKLTAGDKVEYTLRTMPTGKRDLKNQFNLAPTVVDNTGSVYNKIRDFLK